MLNFLERFIRSHLNTWAICMLTIGFVGCVAEFSMRRNILDPVPDGRIFNLSTEQLKKFICDPRKRKPETKTSSETSAKGQESAQKPPTPRCARLYYAATEVTTDVAFPLVYGTFIGMLFWWLYGRAGRALLLIPLAIVAADLTENITFIWLALTFDCETTISEWAVWPNLIKWRLVLLAVLTAVYGLTRKLGAASSTSSP